MKFVRDRTPPDPATLEIRRILLASEGREITKSAIAFAADLAERRRVPVYVFSVARVWGTSLGLPMPGLLPTKGEWDEQREIVAGAVKALRRQGIEARGHVVGTRKGAKRIVAEAERTDCDVIVMAADPWRHWFLGDFMWSQEPQRVRRRARIPVYLVEQPAR